MSLAQVERGPRLILLVSNKRYERLAADRGSSFFGLLCRSRGGSDQGNGLHFVLLTGYRDASVKRESLKADLKPDPDQRVTKVGYFLLLPWGTMAKRKSSSALPSQIKI